MANYDLIGGLAIVKFPLKMKKSEKLKQAKQLLKRKSVKSVLEKSEKVKGRLRTIKTKFLLGQKTLEAVHKENGCVFRLNVESCYFSPRLSEERKQVAEKIKRGERVLVMFAGVNPYGTLIARKGGSVVAVELGRECCKYAKENAIRNKVKNRIEVIQGDVKKKITRKLGRFDVIVMPRPNLKETFLESAFLVSKKGTRVFYYCFGQKKELHKNLEQIHQVAKKKRKKIKILRVRKAGDIGPYTNRWRVDFVLVN